MKNIIAVFALFAGWIGSAFAVCATPYMNGNDTKALLNNKTVCSPANCTNSGGTCLWQEWHNGTDSGSLIEMHAGTTADPQETVGTFSIATTGKVTHIYTGGGGTYNYDVHNDGGGSYTFCGTNGSFGFRVIGPNTRC